ncbi:MAG: low molecular weight phosphatase family protein [Alphaproteobacteria bacterium]|jgi:protein-tyrosine-phosphatase|nr:low molecular weight phosphatase family protein [Alphaproteobacteria bacterium]
MSTFDAASANRSRVLFACTLNSVRSVLAEKLLQQLAGDRFEVHSAGVSAVPVHPFVVAVLAEKGIDCRDHAGQELSDVPPFLQVDEVITLSREAHENLKTMAEFRYDKVSLWELPVPPIDLDAAREQQLILYRVLRDAIELQLKVHFKIS